jgi:hypothetical protein
MCDVSDGDTDRVAGCELFFCDNNESTDDISREVYFIICVMLYDWVYIVCHIYTIFFNTRESLSWNRL